MSAGRLCACGLCAAHMLYGVTEGGPLVGHSRPNNQGGT